MDFPFLCDTLFFVRALLCLRPSPDYHDAQLWRARAPRVLPIGYRHAPSHTLNSPMSSAAGAGLPDAGPDWLSLEAEVEAVLLVLLEDTVSHADSSSNGGDGVSPQTGSGKHSRSAFLTRVSSRPCS